MMGDGCLAYLNHHAVSNAQVSDLWLEAGAGILALRQSQLPETLHGRTATSIVALFISTQQIEFDDGLGLKMPDTVNLLERILELTLLRKA